MRCWANSATEAMYAITKWLERDEPGEEAV
jgi:hypothetical protein